MTSYLASYSRIAALVLFGILFMHTNAYADKKGKVTQYCSVVRIQAPATSGIGGTVESSTYFSQTEATSSDCSALCEAKCLGAQVEPSYTAPGYKCYYKRGKDAQAGASDTRCIPS